MSFKQFKKRFFTSWWNAFYIMKFLHFSRDNMYPDENIDICLNQLNNEYELGFKEKEILTKKLKYMRDFKVAHSNPSHIL